MKIICDNTECYHFRDQPKCHKTIDADSGHNNGEVKCWWFLKEASQPTIKPDAVRKCSLGYVSSVCPLTSKCYPECEHRTG